MPIDDADAERVAGANRRPFPIVALVAALVVWSLLAYAFIFLFSGGHVCYILQTVPSGVDGAVIDAQRTLSPMTDAESAAQMARCNRPDIGAIFWSAVGYVVIAGAAIWRYTEGRPVSRGRG